MPMLRSGAGSTAPATAPPATAPPPEVVYDEYGNPISYDEAGLVESPAPAPATAPSPGLGGVAAYPAPVPSEVYGGPSGVPAEGYNDPSVVVTYYPSTGAEPTARYTEYQWEQYGREAPQNIPTFPASRLLPMGTGVTRPAPGPDRFLPGPPRDYVPGSTYIPQTPNPNPQIPYEERAREGMREGRLDPSLVPGTQAYRRTPESLAQPYPSPGLGAGSQYSPGPLSRHGRPLSRPPGGYITPDILEPNTYIPGSTFVPQWPGNVVGDPDNHWRPIVPTEVYGGTNQLPPHERPRNRRRIDTIHPATGAPETARFIPQEYPANATVLQEPERPSPQRRYPDMGNPTAFYPQPRGESLKQMEYGRRRRRRRGLYGSGR